MNEYDLKSLNINVIGRGKEYFQPIKTEEADNFSDKGLYLGISESFSAPEVTQVFISIGANVVAGLSVYYISKLFDKIFSAKAKAKSEGCDIEITVTIQDKVHIKNVETTIEIEKALEIVLTKNSKSKILLTRRSNGQKTVGCFTPFTILANNFLPLNVAL